MIQICLQKIFAIFDKLRPNIDIANKNNIYQDLKLDSFDLLNLVNMLQNEFNITIDAMDIDEKDFVSIESIERLIERSPKK